MFESYPKSRPPLPKEIQEIYSEHYKLNREGQTTASSLAQRMESWLHRQVARDVSKQQDSKKVTLELGAGTLNQLRYEPAVDMYDIVEPFAELYKNSDLLKRVRNTYADIAEIPANSSYDRITSIATLEHICNLPEVIARCGLLFGGEWCVTSKRAKRRNMVMDAWLEVNYRAGVQDEIWARLWSANET